MTSPTEHRRAFDAAMHQFRSGNPDGGARGIHAHHRTEPGHDRRLGRPTGVRRP